MEGAREGEREGLMEGAREGWREVRYGPQKSTHFL